MKELSIEEKAKRYDEALVRANEMIKAMTNIGGVAKVDDIQHIFPELKESEDEQIIKRIIHALHGDVLDMEETTKAIAWLEKQGEQKHTAEEVLIKAGLKPYKDGDQWCVLLGDNIQEGICGFGNTIEDALYAFLKDLIVNQGEQKPAWSEEDERIIYNIKQFLHLVKDNPQVRNELHEEAKNWLKSLKERYTWKPSDEQINALRAVVNELKHSDNKYQETIEDLYNDLEKLKKE